MSTYRSLHHSDTFCVSSGTVTLDLAHAKILLIYWRKTGEFMLPKGRKNIGETLEQAALRETFEETGYQVQLLPLGIETLATKPDDAKHIKTMGPITEPIAVQQRATNDGTLKIIFWFAARGDSTAAAQGMGTLQDDEEFDAAWVPVDQVPEKLSWEDDRKITDGVLRAAKNDCLIA